MRRAAKIDGTHRAIVKTLESLGAGVVPLHTVGRGCPDIAVSYRGTWALVEIKNGKLGWKLTDAQKQFRTRHNAPVAVLDSVETAIAWILARS